MVGRCDQNRTANRRAIFTSVTRPMQPRNDHGSISFELSDVKRRLSVMTLGEVDVISITLKWALTDLSNVKRGRKLQSDCGRAILFTTICTRGNIERIKRRGRKGYLLA